MYILYSKNKYSCKCRITSSSIVYSGLPDDFSTPVNGEIKLHDNDGFELRTDVVEDYLRQMFEDGTLTLTNIPEPVEPENPEPLPETEPTADDVLNTLLGVV